MKHFAPVDMNRGGRAWVAVLPGAVDTYGTCILFYTWDISCNLQNIPLEEASISILI